MHRSLRSVPVLVAAALLGLPAASNAATPTYPKVSKVSPLKLGIGDTLAVTGKGFRKGKNKTTVVFKREKGRAIFVRAAASTTTRATVTIPVKLLPFLQQKNGIAQPTRFRIRVLAGKLGKTYTAVKSSPVISPRAAQLPGATSPLPTAAVDCSGIADGRDTDKDLLTDDVEVKLGLKPCQPDSDGDGLTDGWEQLSAIDQNGPTTVPSAKTRAYPNALDKADATTDSDGDGLTNIEEYVAWVVSGAKVLAVAPDEHTSRLGYSGGNPNSSGRTVTDAQKSYATYADRDGNGYLTDFERDADGDNIPNMDEVRGLTGGGMSDLARFPTDTASLTDPVVYDIGMFGTVYLQEAAKLTKEAPDELECRGVNQVPYYCASEKITVEKVDTLDFSTADTDGDGIRDDVDDVDHDGANNLSEYLTELAEIPNGKRAFRHLDACRPDPASPLCTRGARP